MRAPVQGNDAWLAVAIVFNQHISGTLDDVKITVVPAGKNRRVAKEEAALAQIQVLGDIGFHRCVGIRVILVGASFPRGRPCLRRLRCDGRNFAIGRIHYE